MLLSQPTTRNTLLMTHLSLWRLIAVCLLVSQNCIKQDLLPLWTMYCLLAPLTGLCQPQLLRSKCTLVCCLPLKSHPSPLPWSQYPKRIVKKGMAWMCWCCYRQASQHLWCWQWMLAWNCPASFQERQLPFSIWKDTCTCSSWRTGSASYGIGYPTSWSPSLESKACHFPSPVLPEQCSATIKQHAHPAPVVGSSHVTSHPPSSPPCYKHVNPYAQQQGLANAVAGSSQGPYM